MKIAVALVLGLSLTVQCQGNIKQEHDKSNDVNEEEVQMKTVLRQLKQGHIHMKRRLYHLTKTLREVEKERDVYKFKDGLQKSEKHSSGSKCILFTADTKANAQINVINSPPQMEWSAANLELQPIKRELSRLNASDNANKQDLLSTRLEMDMIAGSVDETGKDVLSLKAELTQVQTSTKSEISAVNTSLGALWQEQESRLSDMEGQIVQEKRNVLSMKSELTQVQNSLDNTEHEVMSTRSEMDIIAASVHETGKDLLSMKSELTQAQTLLNITEQAILSTGKSVMMVQTLVNEISKEAHLMKLELVQLQASTTSKITAITTSLSAMRNEKESHLSAVVDKLMKTVGSMLECQNPPNIDGSSTVVALDSSGLLTATYSCKEGFINTGGSIPKSICTDGVWSLVEITCTSCARKVGGRIVYSGRMYMTESGRVCQTWSSMYPHKHTWGKDESFLKTSATGPETVLEVSNYCRDPGPSGYLWCYTVDPQKRWERCGTVAQC